MVSREDAAYHLQASEATIAGKYKQYLEDLRQSQYYSVPRPSGVQMTLRKSPLWGAQVSSFKLNFEWPTQQMIAEWPQDISLKSLAFKAYLQDGSYISSV